MKIYMVGAGPGAEGCLTEYAKHRIIHSDLVITTKRLFDKLHTLNTNTVCRELSEFADFIAQNRDRLETVCVLASGDIGFFSIAKTLREKMTDLEVEFVSGVSSLQYLTAKLFLSYEDIKVLSVHGRETNVIPFVCYHKKVFVLTGGKYKARDVINQLLEAGLSQVLVTVGENLSDDNERIITDTPKKLKDFDFDNLAVLLIQNENFVEPHQKIDDSEFIRGKSPMTKEAVRTLSISRLGLKPTDVVMDIGAGTGSVAVEMARKVYEGTVLAVEKEDDAVALIKQNIAKFGAYNVKVIQAAAPDGLDSLPSVNSIKALSPVNKAFIGGSSGNLKGILAALARKKELVKIVVNAVTLETLHEAVDGLNVQGFCTSISCVNVTNAVKAGHYHMMKAENPIYIISGEKQNDDC